MITSFKHILLPIDFTFNTQVAVKKAIELVEPEGGTIHLYHVMKPGFRLSLRSFSLKVNHAYSNEAYSEATRKLKQWKRVIRESAQKVRVNATIIFSADVTRAIIDKAKALQPDLVLISEQKPPSTFSLRRTVTPNRIALKTGVPLLLLKPGCIYNKIKSVVVPVGGFLPERKIELLMALKKKYRMRVHLVTIMDDKESEANFSAQALLNTYRIVKNKLQIPVEYQVLHGNNRAQASLQYAQSVKADMLLVNPESETKLNSFTGVHINDKLVPESRLQILEVEPHHQ